MHSEPIWRGVESLLDKYAKVSQGDTALVLYTSDCYEPAAWVSVGLNLRGVDTRRVWMAPLVDPGFSNRLMQELPLPLSQRLVVLSFERDTMSHTNELAAALSRYPREQYVVLRMISASPEVFCDALTPTPQELSARNASILNRCMSAKQLHITTPGGTDIHVALDKKYRWISNRGAARPGGTIILPAGEVATYPASVSGTFVSDFAFNVNTITDRDARLNKHPAVIRLEAGKVVEFECPDERTERFLGECFAMEHACNIGELGFGTNFGINEPIALNSHMNERRPGVHLGFGQHNQEEMLVNYECQVHLDLIARGGTIWIDEDVNPIDLESINPSSSSHPLHVRDEDVFSPGSEEPIDQDCCGLFHKNGQPPCIS
ncbi:aminopeptidase [Pseudomonas putida]|uniref:aminopeptidase n=1 Tax=Pseudomonas putida TaxID=303 RepID=UPI00235DADD5|nr:aminopeptidase [Pseudomonas putida]GLO46552.1 hypothetical protein PPUN109347_31150 [Pseudomonas putida]HDS0979933.1 aminopeptidase [Pseudomonas putida]